MSSGRGRFESVPDWSKGRFAWSVGASVGKSGRRRLLVGASAGDSGCNRFKELLTSSLSDEVDDDELDEDDESDGGATVSDCGSRVGDVGGSCRWLLDDGWLEAAVVVAEALASLVGGVGWSCRLAILSAVTCNLIRPFAVVERQASILAGQVSLWFLS